jgi:redox-sensitive bicupin YhaK (pirin superfamily)
MFTSPAEAVRMLGTQRHVTDALQARPTSEGAGVRLRRVFGFSETGVFDPFLMLDDFRSDDPTDYRAGFPWHPHRGIETITYVLRGDVEHGDSLGNAGVIGDGDVQWMTAGSGIIHQEMPAGDAGGSMWGFQLWANLPAEDKMMDPRYRGVQAEEIPVVTTPGGAEVRVISGETGGVSGPVRGILTDPEYLDVTLPPGAVFEHATAAEHTVCAYTFAGETECSPGSISQDGTLVLFSEGDHVKVCSPAGGRFLLMSGRPLREPIAWRGPIVMNTQEELREAFREYHEGTFVKVGAHPLG